MLQNLTGWHFLIILIVILLLFGAPKLPALARSLGQSMKIFKSEIKSDTIDNETGRSDDTSKADETSKAAGSTDPTTKS